MATDRAVALARLEREPESEVDRVRRAIEAERRERERLKRLRQRVDDLRAAVGWRAVCRSRGYSAAVTPEMEREARAEEHRAIRALWTALDLDPDSVHLRTDW